ncbi:MAG: SH3 domain-containing protein [Promethearchaeota archaeon]
MEKARVIKQHISEFKQFLTLTKGDIVNCIEKPTPWEGWVYCPEFNGVGGWIPKSYLELQDHNQYMVLRDYNSFEMNVEINEEVFILEETSGWAWVKNKLGKKGWIPLENLEKLR